MKLSFFCIVTLASLLSSVHGKRIPLPYGQLMETVLHVKGSNYIMSSLLSGDVLMLDARTNLITTVVRAPPGRTIQGMAYEKDSGMILTAGSGKLFADIVNSIFATVPNPSNFSMPGYPASINIYDLTTGRTIASCPVRNGNVVNDVAISKNKRFAYFTESAFNNLYRLDLTALPDCRIRTFKTPKTFTGTSLYGAGIATYKSGLLLANFEKQSIYFYDLKLKTFQMIVPESTYGNMDGMRVVYGRCLLATAAYQESVNIFRLRYYKDTRKVRAVFVRSITDPSFTDPTSLTTNGRTLLVTNNDAAVLGNSSTGNVWLSSINLPPIDKLC